MRTRIFSNLRHLVVLLAIPAASSCALKNDVQEATSGCDEFAAGGDALGNLSVDARVKAFAVASAELKTIGDGIRADVKLACIQIATDLGETDAWTGDDSDGSISNGQKTGACDVVATRIEAIMTAGAAAGANFALMVSGGECTVDANVQVSCEESCKTDVTCTEPGVETRCAPAELTGQCQAECNGSATCEGRVDAAANCMGKCEAECQGTCSGEMRGTTEGGCDGMCEGTCDGVVTPSGGLASCAGTCEGKCTQPKPAAMCRGKCSSSCNGACKGQCKLEATAAMNCGATVSCKGGCSVAVTEPKCETELTPPVCTGDTNCQTSCAGQASAHAECSAPTVTLVANLDATGDIAKLKATLEANLPNILLAAKTKGQLAVRALQKVSATGQALIDVSSQLGGKDLACAGTAASASAQAAASMNVSVSASTSVSSSVSAHSS
jgi:hypothetical protein